MFDHSQLDSLPAFVSPDCFPVSAGGWPENCRKERQFTASGEANWLGGRDHLNTARGADE
jgi:hypothetical protein